MLVHIERQNRCAPGERVAMVGRPLVNQFAIAWRPRQQHPSRAAAERFSHGDKLGSPTCKRTKISSNCFEEWATRLTLLAQSIKEEFVQDHRIHRNQLLALESVD